MLEPVYTKQFKKDLDLMLRRGKDKIKIAAVMQALISRQPLETHLRDHSLKGVFKGYRDCHIEPDWLLIYKINENTILFARTGTHADIFE